MKDFDFDELDRAVNSVLTKKDSDPKDESNQDGAVTATADTSAVRNDDSSGSDQSVQASDATSIAVDDSTADDDEADNSSEAVPVSVSVETTPSSDVSSDNSAETETQPEIISDVTPPAQDEVQAPEVSESEEHVTVEQSVEGVHVEQDSTPDESEDSDSRETSQDAETSQSSDNAASLASIPVKRGRFMDMVAPGGSDTKKTVPSRGGITLTPSPDFAAAEKESDEAQNDAPHTDELSSNEDVVATDSQTLPAEESTPSEESTRGDENSAPQDTSTERQSESADATPFIPDVPVEKRPLNPLTPDFQAPADAAAENATNTEETAPVEDQVSVDPTLSANVPKEFDKDVMAVEANETVGESDETHADVPTTNDSQPEASAAPVAETSSPTTIAAATAEPHPMFDTSTLGHTGAAAHHSSKLTWVVVGVSLFVVGAALGVLYFLYGQA